MYNVKNFFIIVIFSIFPILSTAMELKKNTINTLLVDPTKPIEFRAKSREENLKSIQKIKSFNVQIISYNQNGGSFVVINGKRLREGDNFDETTIKKIEKNKVILSNPERKPLVLEYANLSIKKDGGSTP